MIIKIKDMGNGDLEQLKSQLRYWEYNFEIEEKE